MERLPTPLNDCFEIKIPAFADERGKLVKLFHRPNFDAIGINAHFNEIYVSESHKGVLRGLHFQSPPFQHSKIVGCIQGSLFDVVVDIRVGSDTYGHSYSTILDAQAPKLLYVPEGFAHGFVALEDNTLFTCMSSHEYSAEGDAGLLWSSIDVEWPKLALSVSEKDQNQPALQNFESPFQYILNDPS
ncbi:dTDP-4-dehydrorhamnose 3,5-epimerase family protein [Persicobacter psychrovividus]|uniref:dTDP-4-dehydrorhamnose 3,5-epimerase n=1 Tax=Persicobacter psychrovividus TaxID=387638 RepID=A0ABM7VLC4_9BACT|nr:dTDP-4-dehydrorhamnose 3,5-epimerase [Persicobacter psychrovividus]